MRITKYVHSCLLIENQHHAILIDPGQFSWESGVVNVGSLPAINQVVVTHDHFDHFYKPFMDALIDKNPDIKVVGPESIFDSLQTNRAKNSAQDMAVEIIHARHASMAPLNPIDPPTENFAYHLFDELTHPGDSLEVKESKRVFCMPLAGPWASAIEAVRYALELSPEIVIPIHDWMWNESWRKEMYARLEPFFAQHNIRFVSPIDGKSFEV